MKDSLAGQKSLFPPMHNEGVKFVIVGVVLTFLLTFLYSPLAIFGALLTGFVYYFFRNPERIVPDDPSAIVSPADGTVCMISQEVPPAELELGGDAPMTRVCVFMSVFNVHVNRIPTAGKITKTFYIPGQFVNASMDKASELNERMLYALETPSGRKLAFVQIAGLIARRIVSFIKEGDNVKTGARFGLIRFGSRVDLYLPAGVEPKVLEGQTVVAGETVMAKLP